MDLTLSVILSLELMTPCHLNVQISLSLQRMSLKRVALERMSIKKTSLEGTFLEMTSLKKMFFKRMSVKRMLPLSGGSYAHGHGPLFKNP